VLLEFLRALTWEPDENAVGIWLPKKYQRNETRGQQKDKLVNTPDFHSVFDRGVVGGGDIGSQKANRGQCCDLCHNQLGLKGYDKKIFSKKIQTGKELVGGGEG